MCRAGITNRAIHGGVGKPFAAARNSATAHLVPVDEERLCKILLHHAVVPRLDVLGPALKQKEKGRGEEKKEARSKKQETRNKKTASPTTYERVCRCSPKL